MMDETAKFILTVVVGTGVLTAAFQAYLNSRLATKLERQRALIQRDSKVYEEQLALLTRLYGGLFELQEYLKHASKSGFAQGESPEAYRQILTKRAPEIAKDFYANQLLLPDVLCGQVNTFFRTLGEGQLRLDFFYMGDVITPDQRAPFFEGAKKTAYEQLPVILGEIKTLAKDMLFAK